MSNGFFGEGFPYTNFHDLNMDWIVKIAKDFLDQYSNIQTIISNGIESIGNKTDEGIESIENKTNTGIEAITSLTADELASLANKATELEALLNQWYTTHSQDIADQLTEAIAQFYLDADAKTAACIASIPADYTSLANEVSELYDTVNIFNFNRVPYTSTPSTTLEGITWSTLDHGVIKAVGETTHPTNAQNLFYYTTLPADRLKAGSTVLLYQNSSDADALYMELFVKHGTGSLTYTKSFRNKNGFTTWKIPSDVTTILWRAYVRPNAEVNDTIFPAIVLLPENNNHFTDNNPDFPLGYDQFGEYWGGTDIDLNTINDNAFYLLTDAGTYLHKPIGMTFGFLQCVTTGRWHLQIAYDFFGGAIYKRRGTPDGNTWEDWQQTSGSTYNITNNYEYPSYSQTVNLTATPVITADTNQFLSSSGDTTDRTADILAMLQANKVCRLGPGVFYVDNLQMPEYSLLTGCGYITTVRLKDGVTGSAIHMNSYCTVENLRVEGANTVPSITSTVGDRHGISWTGNYSTSTSDTKWRGIINNVYIRWFTGGGITCYNTGYGMSNGLEVTNAWIWRCGAGLYIPYISEYHTFTNIISQECYYGCINNGGNNMFINCDFSGNIEYGMVIDNSSNQSPNNSHGSAIGCIFNHTYHNSVANSGVGIHIMNCQNGFIFDGCQIFFSQIIMDRADGVVFSNCNFGYSNCNITITDGGVIMFNGNMHQQKAPITISNNEKVHFINCYDRSNGNLVTP